MASAHTTRWQAIRKRAPVRQEDPPTDGELLEHFHACRGESAFAELDRLGEEAVPGLRDRLAGVTTLETRRRITQLLEQHDPATPRPEVVRRLRALEILEQVATPEARALLRVLGRGAAGARLTREAQGALLRLGGRPPTSSH